MRPPRDALTAYAVSSGQFAAFCFVKATGAIGLQGVLIPYSTAPATVTVQLLAAAGDTSTFNNVTASAAITPPAAADHSLMNLQILPRNIALGAGSASSPY